MSISDYTPGAGGFKPKSSDDAVKRTLMGDRDRLEQKLEILLGNCRIIQKAAEKQMSGMALTVGDFDSRLLESHEKEWPNDSLGDPADVVSFRYYKTLRLRNTTTAGYIRKRYEEAARDITGNKAIDILMLSDITKKEALLIQEFLNKKGQYIGSAAEKQVLENLEVWVQSAAIQTQKLHKYLIREEEYDPGSSEGFAATAKTAKQAKRSQAVLKVSLNGYNDSIEQELDALRRNFSAYARTFYFDHLAPVVEAYDASSSIGGGASSKELSSVSRALESRLASTAEDQKRRTHLYRDRLDSLQELISKRDIARYKIKSLGDIGKSMPVVGPAVMASRADTAAEVKAWDEEEKNAIYGEEADSAVSPPISVGKFTSDHSDLLNRDDPDAHAQYLLRSGGTITGDVLMSDSVTIDGIVPSTHRHTGVDGSAQIDGRDIVPGTLGDDLIDTDDKPPVPLEFRIDSFTQAVIPPGVTVIDTVLAWEGDEKYSYEVQLRRIA